MRLTPNGVSRFFIGKRFAFGPLKRYPLTVQFPAWIASSLRSSQ
jgi:hypothetical protein